MVPGGNVGSGDSMVAAVYIMSDSFLRLHGFSQSFQLSGLNIIITSIFWMRKLRYKVFA